MSLLEQRLPTLPEHRSSLPVCVGFLLLYLEFSVYCFVDQCLYLVFFFGHYIACFSIYGFWLPLCCLCVPATLVTPVVLLLNDKIIMWYGNRKSIWNMTHTKNNDGKEDTNIIFTRTSYRITFYQSTLITFWISIKRIVTCTDT